MLQAITTRYEPPNNRLDARIIVRAQAGRMTVPWDDALGIQENHERAALAFAKKWEWDKFGRWIGGGLPGGGYVFVCAEKKRRR